MGKKNYFILLFCLIVNFSFAQQENQRPKLGLALSGGGAKGLAHIGLLKAIDSAGIKIEYVSGTSMGSIIGTLYAMGYSGKDIETIANKIDWNQILTNKAPYKRLIIPQKEDFGKFLDLSLVKGKISFKKGIIESNELWLVLNEHFFPYLTEKDFSRFPREFRCIAANMDNGAEVELSHGNITKSVRASMAIPSFFTPVEIDGKYLVDGGIVRNFPVSTAKKMGADFVIGSSVSAPLQKGDSIDSPVDILSQVVFYREDMDYQKQLKSSDLFVKYDLGKYGSNSFASAPDILKIGSDKGKELYPTLKKLKDSLDQKFGPDQTTFTVKRVDKIKVAHITSEGLDPKAADFFMKSLGFKEQESYSAADISENIRRVFGFGVFRKITYELEKNDENTVNLKIIFEPNLDDYIKAGLHYNSETGIALKLGFAKYGLFNSHSLTSFAISLGENPQIAIRRTNFINANRKMYLNTHIFGEYTDIYTYNDNFKKSGFFNQLHFKTEMSISYLLGSNLSAGLGIRYEFMKYAPKIAAPQSRDGKINYLHSFANFKWNTLDTPHYPQKGGLIDLEGGYIFNQKPTINIGETANDYGTQYPDFSKKPYLSFKLSSAYYIPVHKHTIFMKVNSGIQTGNKIPFMNYFLIGGTNSELRNQILFSGFRVNSIQSSSVFSPQVGFRYRISNSLYASINANYLMYDFVKNNLSTNSHAKSMFGGAVSLGYNSFLGPIDISFMMNNIKNSISPNINIGYALNF